MGFLLLLLSVGMICERTKILPNKLAFHNFMLGNTRLCSKANEGLCLLLKVVVIVRVEVSK